MQQKALQAMVDTLEQVDGEKKRRFRRYPEYKYSGVEWLGGVPAHWEVTKMKRCFVSGRMPAAGNSLSSPNLKRATARMWFPEDI